MIISVFLRHFKIYKNINYIPLSDGDNFSSIIGENGCGKSSILEALDFCFNKKGNNDWPINNEAKSESGVGGENFPYIVPAFLISKEVLRKDLKSDLENYSKALLLSDFFWTTTHKTKAKGLDDFFSHRDTLKQKYKPEEYLFLLAGKKQNDSGIYFGSFNNQLTFINNSPNKTYDDDELQKYFKGFYEYIYSHYSYIYIPVETDVNLYTKLETLDMQKLMDKNIKMEIENAIKPGTVSQINKNLDKFVSTLQDALELYFYKGSSKNNLTTTDLVAKIIEAYFSIKVLHKRVEGGSKAIPVSELSSGEKRKALIDVAYSFLSKNNDRNSNIILAIDEPEASLHVSNCYEQFDKLFQISKSHQILVSTHWYGYLPIISNGSATAIKKNNKNEISYNFLNLYNYRESIIHKKKETKGPLPIDYNIKSYNDLVQSIIHSIITDNSYKWIICEGKSEKIYFDYYFKDEIDSKKLRILPLGGYKEVKKLYSYLIAPIQDPDYNIRGKVFCLIDTDEQKLEIKDYINNKHLFFERLLLNDQTVLVEVNNNSVYPPTEIEDCLDPKVFFHTLQNAIHLYPDLAQLFDKKEFDIDAKFSMNFFDLTIKEKKMIKNFFDCNQGENKIIFAEHYIEIIQSQFFQDNRELEWVNQIKKKLDLI